MLTAAKNSISKKMFNKIQLPDNVGDVIRYNPEDECDPEIAGMSHQEVQSIWTAVVDLYKTGMYPGLGFCLRRDGHVVLNRTLGHAHGNGPDDTAATAKTVLTPETPMCLFSASKAVTAVLMHMLVERGLINLSDPVSKYLPRFSSHGKDKTTILQMLSHQGGIPVLPEGLDIELNSMFDQETVIDILYDMKPIWPAGDRVGYHAATSGFIFAEIVKVVTGKDIRSFLDETIRNPLGFKYFNYGIGAKDLDKVATEYYTGATLFPPVSTFLANALGVPIDEVIELCNDPGFKQAIIPSANILGTAEEVSRFYQILLDGGELDGKVIMSPETVYSVVAPVTEKVIDDTIKIPIQYSAGLMLGRKRFSLYGPKTKSAYGHMGFANNFCWADPDREIAVGLLTSGNPIIGNHMGKLFGLLGSISKNCPMM
ncbi:MAG: beta-lactamase family protein [Pseudomonadales bacterium]|nr:beta-lactamase family protein [Pseudomonadales bacterium]